MLPLSLYIHIPWCVLKCPYCDFNSHKSPRVLPEIDYVNALLDDLKTDLASYPKRPIHTVFIGGGTPSLLSERAYERLFEGLHQHLDLSEIEEITLEANPNSAERNRFKAYHALGINRLSLGIQSFNPRHLKALGRAHDDKDAMRAIEAARSAGFDNINLDIMHSLPNQSIVEAINDVEVALSHAPEHISWYQLTLEPNTVFYKKPPKLPDEDTSFELEQKGKALLKQSGFINYEISAFAKPNRESKHNLNYWQFGDYFGIGAGAHGKWSTPDISAIYRLEKKRQPKDYLNPKKTYLSQKKLVDENARIFEFMLNATRLNQPIPYTLFTERTGLSIDRIYPLLLAAAHKGFLSRTNTHWQITEFGRQFTNDLQGLFLV